MKLNFDALFDAGVHLFYPRRCVGCGEIHETLSANRFLCPSCLVQWMEALSVPCPVCGKVGMECRCGASMPSSSPADGYYHLVPYRTPVLRGMLFRMKKRPDRDTAAFLANQMALLCEAAIKEHGLPRDRWIITYPPRSPEHENEQGTDQSEALSRRISHLLGIPCMPFFIHAEKTAAQKELTAAGRRENAQSSYSWNPKTAAPVGKAVFLVDDVITTGATLHSCTALLKGTGAECVVCVTAAKTLLQPDKDQQRI